MIAEEIRDTLFAMRDADYGAFQSKLIPSVAPESIIGVRTPELRRFAKQLLKRADVTEFLSALPHRYFDENQLHAFILSEMKEYDRCVEAVSAFLPFVDNWATCDQMSPRVFRTHRQELLSGIRAWIDSKQTYTVRFGVGMLMEHYLEEDFDANYPEWVASIRSEDYYVRMMVAWYFATALAKRYDLILPYFEHRRLEPWTHRKAIQKAVESFRITPEQKAYLKTLRNG